MPLIKIKNNSIVVKPNNGLGTKYVIQFENAFKVEQFLKDIYDEENQVKIKRFERHNCVIRKDKENLIIDFVEFNKKDDVKCVINFTSQEIEDGIHLNIINQITYPIKLKKREKQEKRKQKSRLILKMLAKKLNVCDTTINEDSRQSLNVYDNSTNTITNGLKNEIIENNGDIDIMIKDINKILKAKTKGAIKQIKNKINNEVIQQIKNKIDNIDNNDYQL